MNVGISYQNEQNAVLSGKTSAEAALRHGNIDRPDLVLAFCSGQLDLTSFSGVYNQWLESRHRLLVGRQLAYSPIRSCRMKAILQALPSFKVTCSAAQSR